MPRRGPNLIDPRLARALEHPIRTDILNVLREGPSSPTRIQRQLDNVSLNLVAHHMKVLKDIGCIELVETVSKQGAKEHIYRGVGLPILSDEEWRELTPEQRRKTTVTILRKISHDLAGALGAGLIDRGLDTHLSRSPLKLDSQGWDDIAELLVRTLHEVLEIGDESLERCEDRGEEPIHAMVGLMQFPLAQE